MTPLANEDHFLGEGSLTHAFHILNLSNVAVEDLARACRRRAMRRGATHSRRRNKLSPSASRPPVSPLGMLYTALYTDAAPQTRPRVRRLQHRQPRNDAKIQRRLRKRDAKMLQPLVGKPAQLIRVGAPLRCGGQRERAEDQLSTL